MVSISALLLIAFGVAPALGDPSASGLSNLLTYALGADLLPVPSSALPTVTIVSEAGTQFVAIEYRRRSEATDIEYSVEMSSDLVLWDGMTIPVTIVDNGDGTETVTTRAFEPTDSSNRQFLRLGVSVR